jgi:HD-GYP domain-containing protein (c-di-GMP phosphodiesterase class II)
MTHANKRWQVGKLPLHVPIAVLFSLLILVVGGLISVYHFHQTSRLLSYDHDRLFAEIAGRAHASLSHATTTVKNTFILLGESTIADAISLPQRLVFLEQLTSILESDSLTESVAVGYDSGDLLIVQRAKPGTAVPQGAVWEVQNIDGSITPTTLQLQYFDKSLHFIASQFRSSEGYEPRRTNWYRDAATTNRLIVTQPYALHASGAQGVSFAKRNGGVVLAIDVSLSAISKLLAGNSMSPSSNLLLLDEHGVILTAAHGTTGDTVTDTGAAAGAIEASWRDYPTGTSISKKVSAQSRSWLVALASMPGFGGKAWTLGIAAPEDEVFAEAYRQRQHAFFFTFIAVLLSIPIAWLISRTLTSPLQRLANDARSITALRFDNPVTTRSAILEVDQLATTMIMMQGAVSRFLELGRSLGSAQAVSEVLREVVAGSREVSSAPWGVVSVVLKEGSAALRVEPESFDLAADESKSMHPLVLAAFNEHAHLLETADGPLSLAVALPNGEVIQLLGIPLRTPQHEHLGVLLLADRRSNTSGLSRAEVAGFLLALAGTAAIALQNQKLLSSRKELLQAVIRMIAKTIDAKSPYTGKHCSRVPELAYSLAQAADLAKTGPFAGFHLSTTDWEALDIAAWLHDCGKLTTPEFVVDKATKLETLYNRIHEIRMRFEVLKRDAEIAYWKDRFEHPGEADLLREHLGATRRSIDDDYNFVAQCNLGSHPLTEADLERLAKISQRTWLRTLDDRIGLSRDELERKSRSPAVPLPAEEPVLADRTEHILERNGNMLKDVLPGLKMQIPDHLYDFGELHNLSIDRGTLTEEERFKINEHIIQTIVMLNSLPYPPDLANVPEIAGGHHETMDGSGYPLGLKRDQMSIQARIIAIADVFEALTAFDRPYKQHQPVTTALSIMAKMRNAGKLDADLFNLFLTSDVWKEYAERNLREPTCDVDVSQYVSTNIEKYVN